ncbi:hypothetical protein N3K66_002451 [Trichothecium roseum]|uniref:Uncharacterized protein n=1 Tax=Trichothecium roseum TaxID=47278 RepID=A0ACC0V9N2_9HYPO|nr:hypothetical protein N3K66_002451 [Trichothecium roseum]
MSQLNGSSSLPSKPRLKINISRNNSIVEGKPAATSATTPATATAATPVATKTTSAAAAAAAGGPKTPALASTTSAAAAAATPSHDTIVTPTTAAERKTVKLKISASQPPTPADVAPPPSAKTKAGRQPKPTQKLVESKKRPHDDSDEDAPLSASMHPATKIKIKQKAGGGIGTQLVVKPRGKPPVHPPGDGYDSEASDRETDPAIEEQFVLRMLPGEHCEYVRWCIENGKMGVSKAQGGADVQIKFFEEDTRRAVVVVKSQPYAGVMVDLPTITESMKTWDRKNFMKSADICQMLLIYRRVETEAAAKVAELPSVMDTHFKWPHGLTPPMHDCVHRRFAKTISRKEIEDKEAEVDRLLVEDAKASATRWEWIDQQEEDEDDDDEDDDDEDDEMEDEEPQDAEGEDEYFVMPGAEDNDGLEADLEAAFADELLEAETPATGVAGVDGVTPMAGSTQVTTPAVHQSIEADEEEEEDDDESDDDDDDDDDDDLDDDEREERDERAGVMSMISDMEKQLAQRQAELEKQQNKILRGRIETQIKQLRSEIELKKKSINLDPDDD